jgi:tetratricopeptide (TPR) repeat protein
MSGLGRCSLTEVAERAGEAAGTALKLDPRSGAAHYANGLFNLFQHWRADIAEAEFRRALELEPASVQSRCGYAQLKFATGETAEAIRLLEEALRLDPASPRMGARYCQAFYFARDYQRAEAECRKVLDREPRYAMAQYYLALSLAWLGHTDQAQHALKGISLMPEVLEVDRAWLTLRQGDRRPALEALERRREQIRQGKMSPTANILLCTMLGRNDEAFAAIEEAISRRAFEMLTLSIDPRLDGLRGDSRYPDVLRRIGMARI